MATTSSYVHYVQSKASGLLLAARTVALLQLQQITFLTNNLPLFSIMGALLLKEAIHPASV
jgi:hypothetical protein